MILECTKCWMRPASLLLITPRHRPGDACPTHGFDDHTCDGVLQEPEEPMVGVGTKRSKMLEGCGYSALFPRKR